jgi:hypothetical protein
VEQMQARVHEKVCVVFEERVTSVRTIDDLVRAYRSATFPDAGSQMTEDSRAAATSRADVRGPRRKRS